jgi:phospholipid/cholesterol/gamma-HCH transport system substrate-binding protein
LPASNPRSIAICADFSALGGFSDALSSAAPGVVSILDAMNPTSATITKNAKLSIDSLLAGLDGLSDSSVKT